MAFIPKERSDIWHGFPLRDLNDATRIFLEAVHQVPGVQEAFVSDRAGDLLGAYVGASWDKDKTSAIAIQVAQLLVEGERGRAAREMEIRLAQGGLFVRGLGNAFALIVCAPNVDWAMLRMTLNVAATAYETNIPLQNLIQAARETRPGESISRSDDDSNMWAKFP